MKKSSFFSLLTGCVSMTLSACAMQETGPAAPAGYYHFNLPVEVLSVVKTYLPDNPVIVDAGAFDGEESCVMAHFWPHGQIHAFEPVTELYGVLSNRVRKERNVTAYKFALGDKKEQKMIYLSAADHDLSHVTMSSSLYPPKEHLFYSTTLFQGAEMVDVITLDQWSDMYGIYKVDMLWLDMQGYELPAIKASPKILKGVSVILTEVEFVEAYAGQALYQETKAFLEEQGFELIGGNFTFPKGPKQWFGDGLFVRRELLKR